MQAFADRVFTKADEEDQIGFVIPIMLGLYVYVYAAPAPAPPKHAFDPFTHHHHHPPHKKITQNTHSARSASDKNTARTFYAAGVFYDVMQQFKAVPGEGRCVCCLSFCRGPLAALVASCVSFVHMADRCFFGGPYFKQSP